MASARYVRNMEIVAQLAQGTSIVGVAREYGLSATRVRQILEAYGGVLPVKQDEEVRGYLAKQSPRFYTVVASMARLKEEVALIEHELNAISKTAMQFRSQRLPREGAKLPVLDREVVCEQAEVSLNNGKRRVA